MRKLSDVLTVEHIVLDLEAGSMEDALRRLVARLVAGQVLTQAQAQALEQALVRQPDLAVTALGRGVVVPHAYIPGLPDTVVLLARLAPALAHEAPDGRPVDLLLLLAGPEEAERQHLPLLARTVRLLHDERLLAELREARGAPAVLEAVRAVERRHA